MHSITTWRDVLNALMTLTDEQLAQSAQIMPPTANGDEPVRLEPEVMHAHIGIHDGYISFGTVNHTGSNPLLGREPADVVEEVKDRLRAFGVTTFEVHDYRYCPAKHPPPYPWRCSSCGKDDVEQATISYEVTIKRCGLASRVVMSNLQILQCGSCAAIFTGNDTHDRIYQELLKLTEEKRHSY